MTISISRLWRSAKWRLRLRFGRDPYVTAVRQWNRDRGDELLRLDYPLSRESVVVDVGAYHGDWAAAISSRYGCTVHTFEAVPSFADEIEQRFRNTFNVIPHRFGLGAEDSVVRMGVFADGSSAFRNGSTHIHAPLHDIDAALRDSAIGEIDLIKINIEGGEYALLRRMLDRDIVRRCRDIQVQFHLDFPDAVAIREQLRRELQRTHRLTYDYYFVWENWRRTEGGSDSAHPSPTRQR